MKKGKSILTRRVLAGLLAGVLLGSVAYVQPADAGQIVKIETQDDYDNAGNDVKDSAGDIIPSGSASGNQVYIGTAGGGDVPLIGSSGSEKNVYGGYVNNIDGAVTNNQVCINNGQMGDVTGGRGASGSGDITGNSVTISGGTLKGSAYGGHNSADAERNIIGNTVTIKGGSIGVSVYGARNSGKPGNVKGNKVYIEAGTIGLDVLGAFTGSPVAIAEENSVTITGGTIKNSVYGARNGNGIETKNNSVDISGDGTTIGGSVYGGYSGSSQSSSSFAEVTENAVSISGGTITKDVYGGFIGEGTGLVKGNIVNISGGQMRSVYGGYSERSGKVENNSVTISKGKINVHVYGGCSASGTVTENKVHITGGIISGSIYGGRTSDNGTAEGNSVTISNGMISNHVYGGFSDGSGTVIGNSVTIAGGTVKYDVRGGHSYSGLAKNNKVYISGGTIEKNVYGGINGSGSSATGNSVTISGAPKFGENTVLYGGYTVSGTVSGNILNIHTKDLTVANVEGFDVYNFYLQNDTQAGNTLLNLTGGSGSESTSLDGSTINVGMEGSAPALQVGDSITLVKNENGITGDVTYGKIKDGVSIEYEFTTELEGGTALVSRVTRAGISGDSKSPVETQLAAAAFINSGADLLAGSGVSSAVTAAGGGNAEMFGAMSGGSMRYKSGSHADVHGYNMALGVGKAIANKAGQLTFGHFVEYGYGNYTSHLDSGVRGDGNTKYYGIGMLARQDNTSGVYYEGSLRYGRMDTDYSSNDMSGSLGRVHTQYDSSSAYYGAHLGIGKVTELNDSTKADVYAKLLYTHQSGDSVALQGAGAGEEYDFDAVDSTRARVGARVSKAYGSRSSGYVGVAYEYEFNGEARATVKGFSTPSPSIKGSSGLLELGYILQPQAANDPAINIGLQGWGGKKQGFTGNVNFVWTF